MSKKVDFSPATGPCDLLVIAGEASGDEHAARLIEDLSCEHPGLKISALGGNELSKTGANMIYPLADHAVVGLIEVIKNYSFFEKYLTEQLHGLNKSGHAVFCLLIIRALIFDWPVP